MPLLFVAVRKVVDCAFAYLEDLGVWGEAAGSAGRPPQVVHGGAEQLRATVERPADGSLTDTDAGLVGAVNGCTDPCEPAAPHDEPVETGLHTYCQA